MVANSGDSGLTLKQRRAIEALLTAQTVADAARAAGVHENTVARWLREEPFRTALQEAQAEVVDALLARIVGAQSEALTTLQRVARDGSEAQSVAAAKAILGLLPTYKWLDIDRQILELRKAMGLTDEQAAE